LSNGAVTIQNRHLSIVKGDGRTDWERDLEAPNVLMSSPMLRYQNKDEVLAKSAFNDNRHPRSCLCLTNDQRLLLVVVDGRSSSAFGMSLAELNFLTKQLNCHTTLNLDGGGSTTLYVRGQPFNGVVNCPTDNKIFDHEGERLVSNIFYVK
jgi:exopolysaccharide biosynthesis protein